MSKPRIVFLDNFKIGKSNLEKLEFLGEIIQGNDDWPDEQRAVKLASSADIIVSKWVYVSAKILKASPNLRYVIMAMTGYHDWVDIAAAKKLNIPVSNVPDFSSVAVAEHTILLMLSVKRKLLAANSSLKNGLFNPKIYQGTELSGKTLGIIGFGRIGRKIAHIARSFGMNILYVNSRSSRKDLEKLLSQSQIISINTPLTHQTERLIGEKELRLLPQGSVIINTSRGKVIDEKALIRNLGNGHLGGAGLDVFSREPPDKNNPLFTLPNVVATPHIAWNTQESYKRLSDGVVVSIISFLQNKLINIVS